MPKRTVYTKITPLPSNIPRQLALDMLHSHGEIIELNPLVITQHPTKAPKDAGADEFFAAWYEITERITWGFGISKKISFKGVFHDMPWGLQTHIYAPMGVDLRNKYQIRGNQPGEPRETRELGVDAPSDGLYLREDVEIVCNMTLTSFVKKETMSATGILVERLVRKAELLDEGRLQAMFEDGKLKTVNPALRDMYKGDMYKGNVASPLASPALSPNAMTLDGFDEDLPEKKFGNYHAVARHQSQIINRQSYAPQYQPRNGSQSGSQSGYTSPSRGSYTEQPMGVYQQPQGLAIEMPGSYDYSPPQPSSQFQPSKGPSFVAELPGTSPNMQQTAQMQSQQHPAYRQSQDMNDLARARGNGYPSSSSSPAPQRMSSTGKENANHFQPGVSTLSAAAGSPGPPRGSPSMNQITSGMRDSHLAPGAPSPGFRGGHSNGSTPSMDQTRQHGQNGIDPYRDSGNYVTAYSSPQPPSAGFAGPADNRQSQTGAEQYRSSYIPPSINTSAKPTNLLYPENVNQAGLPREPSFGDPSPEARSASDSNLDSAIRAWSGQVPPPLPERDANRYSWQQTPTDATNPVHPALRPDVNTQLPGREVQCPVCHQFEGDELSVQHHVAEHFK